MIIDIGKCGETVARLQAKRHEKNEAKLLQTEVSEVNRKATLMMIYDVIDCLQFARDVFECIISGS